MATNWCTDKHKSYLTTCVRVTFTPNHYRPTVVIFTSDTEERPNLTLSQCLNDYLIYVEPLLLEGNIIGFNRVILYRHDVQKLQREHYQQRSNETLFLTLLALVIGGLITSNIYTFKNNGKLSSKGVSQ